MTIKIDEDSLRGYRDSLKNRAEELELQVKDFRNAFLSYDTWRDNNYMLLSRNMNFQIERANELIDRLYAAAGDIDAILDLLQIYFNTVAGI